MQEGAFRQGLVVGLRPRLVHLDCLTLNPT